MKTLSKSSILKNLQCPRYLWLDTYQSHLRTDSTSNSQQRGITVGEVARAQFSSGVLIERGNPDEAIDQTHAYIAQMQHPIFEGAIRSQDVLVYADTLIPQGDAWRLVEVKSTASVKQHQLQDAAIQYWVAQSEGVPLSSVEIAHINTAFRYPGNQDYQGLFHFEDIGDDISDLVSQVPNWIAKANNTLNGKDPQSIPGSHCTTSYDCPYFDHCNEPVDPSIYPVEILPRATKLHTQLQNAGYEDIRDVPDGLLEKPLHERIRIATITGLPYIDPNVASLINALPYPRYYIDFETIQMAIPIWEGTRPYSQIPFQWSCHIEESPGNITHTEFLGDGKSDPLRAFAESLLVTLGKTGAILVYNAGFENTRIKELANDFPDLSDKLFALLPRVIDLLPIARNHYYHPDMRGSWSIKAVLPTIAPNLSYNDLEVSNGTAAQEAFMSLMLLDSSSDEYQAIYRALLSYCELDTLGLVKIAHHFSVQ